MQPRSDLCRVLTRNNRIRPGLTIVIIIIIAPSFLPSLALFFFPLPLFQQFILLSCRRDSCLARKPTTTGLDGRTNEYLRRDFRLRYQILINFTYVHTYIPSARQTQLYVRTYVRTPAPPGAYIKLDELEKKSCSQKKPKRVGRICFFLPNKSRLKKSL